MLVVLDAMLYGAVVAVPRSTEPSHQNSTRLTPWSSLAVPANVAIPVIVVFVLLRRHCVRGIAMSGLKG